MPAPETRKQCTNAAPVRFQLIKAGAHPAYISDLALSRLRKAS